MKVYNNKEDSKFSHSLSAVVVVVLSHIYGWIACTCETLQQRVQQSFMQFVVVLCHHMVVLFVGVKSLQQVQ